MSLCKSLLLLSLLGLGSAVASDLNFTLVNETSRSFEAVYVSAADDADWDGNVLPDGGVLAVDGKLAVKFQGAPKSAKWDLKVVDSDGVAVTFEDVNLIDVESITLKGEDGKYVAEVE